MRTKLLVLTGVVLSVCLFGIAKAAPTSTIVNNLIVTGQGGSGTKCLHINNSGFVSTSTDDCGTGSGGGGSATTTINGINGPNFIFSTTTDPNLGIVITGSGSTLSFAPIWIGTLSNARITSSSYWSGKLDTTGSGSSLTGIVTSVASSSQIKFSTGTGSGITALFNYGSTTGNIFCANGTDWTTKAVGSNGKVLMASSTAPCGISWETVSSSGGGAGTPGGLDMQIQFNDGGSFGGDSDFQWYKTANKLSLGNASGTFYAFAGPNLYGSNGGNTLYLTDDATASSSSNFTSPPFVPHLRLTSIPNSTSTELEVYNAAGYGFDTFADNVDAYMGLYGPANSLVFFDLAGDSNINIGGSLHLGLNGNTAGNEAILDTSLITSDSDRTFKFPDQTGTFIVNPQNSNTVSDSRITVRGGSAVSGDNAGGPVQLVGGDASGIAAAGNVGFIAGYGGASGTDGYVYIADPTSNTAANFRTTLLSGADKDFTFPNQSGVFGLVISATTNPIGGSALLAGACSATTTTVTGARITMGVSVTPATTTSVGDSAFWKGYVSANDVVTTKVCEVVAGTPVATAYNIRVTQ